MKKQIFVIGNASFQTWIKQKASNQILDFSIASRFEELANTGESALYFCSVKNVALEHIKAKLKQGNDIILFDVHDLSIVEMSTLLELAIESNSLLVNGDSLLFNPVLYEIRDQLKDSEISTISSNQTRFMTRKSIFNCLELVVKMNDTSVKTVRSKAVRLDDQFINFIHIRVEFENGNLGVLEMSNCKPIRKLQLESVGKVNFFHADLLTFNGHQHRYGDFAKEKHMYAKQRNSVSILLDYIENQMPKVVNPNYQFFHTIKTNELICTIEEQLRRELPNFSAFVDVVE